jgi:GxxExxY protein
MPIRCGVNVSSVSDQNFEEINRLVMKCAFGAHNCLGRLCDEGVFEKDMANRLRAEGITETYTQVPVEVGHESFAKTYRLDLVVNQLVYELKVVEAFSKKHDAQAYNYAGLLDINRVNLLNFGEPSVEGKLIRTPFDRIDRRKVTVDRSHWKPVSDGCRSLADKAESCVNDWGGFLESGLYQESMIWFLGGEGKVLTKLPVMREGALLGQQSVALHSPDCGFSVTTFGKRLGTHRTQLKRLLKLLPIRAWQLINLYHETLQLITIERGD